MQLDEFVATIRAYVLCRGKHLFAMEFDKPYHKSHDSCPLCYTKHVDLPYARCVYQPVESIRDAIAKQNAARRPSQTSPDVSHTRQNLPPLDTPITGRDKGIAGDSNSCYMDSTIFCMFAYSGVFDRLLHMNVDRKLTNLQRILRDNVVHILRGPDGFVASMIDICLFFVS